MIGRVSASPTVARSSADSRAYSSCASATDGIGAGRP